MSQVDFLTTLTELTANNFGKLGFTENNAKSNVFADKTLEKEGLIGLLYKSVRGVDDNIL